MVQASSSDDSRNTHLLMGSRTNFRYEPPHVRWYDKDRRFHRYRAPFGSECGFVFPHREYNHRGVDHFTPDAMLLAVN
jgi:hypothetical protein